MYIGDAYDYYRMTFVDNHPVYQYKNGGLRLYAGTTDAIAWDKITGKPSTFTPASHTHSTTLATDTGTSAITLAYGGKYKLSTGGTSTIFTMPASDNTNTTYTLSADGANVKLTPSSGTATTAGLSDLINGLGEGTSAAQGADYLVAQYAGGGTTTKTYHRRSVANVVNKTVVDTALGKGSDTTKYYRNDGT